MADKNTELKTALVRDLAELLVDLDLSEIDVKDANIRIRLTRGMGGTVVAAPVMAAQSAPVVAAPAVAAPESKSVSGNEVPSPMVGTIYLAPSPDASDYVSVGSTVREGDTLLIIEAMKTMNHIPAPRSGTVTAILVEDKQPVEFGEPLIVIE